MSILYSMETTGREVPSLQWDLEEDLYNHGDPLLQDTFLGCTLPDSPPQFVKSPSVVFVGPEQDNNGGYGYQNEATTTNSEAYNDYDSKWLNEYMSVDMMMQVAAEEAAPPVPMEVGTSAEFAMPSSSHSTAPESHDSYSFDQYSYPSPGSTYSSSRSVGSVNSGSSMSQDEIFEEIQRECAEIERHSVSPKSRKQKKGHTRKAVRSQTIKSQDERKKELNRIAATKYREKKRREREGLWGEEKELTARNAQLTVTVQELSTEIEYLKKLLKDMKVRATS